MVSPKKKSRFQIKLTIENNCFRVNLSYFDELQLQIKISKEIIRGVKFSQIRFFTKGCSDFFHLIYPSPYFPFLTRIEEV